jgi:OmpA-OmpF porin, OOP family
MKLWFILLATTSLVLPGLAAAQPVTGPYVSGGAGVNLLQDQTIAAAPSLREPKRTALFDPGFAGQVSLGYGLGNGLRVEIEGDYLNNKIRKVEFPDALHRAGGSEQQYGGMVNALYDFDLGLPFYPYLGVGAGGQIVQFDNFNASTAGFRFPDGGHGGSESVGSFAYQGIAGVSMPLPWVAGLSVTAEYRMLGLLDPLPAIRETVYSDSSGGVIGVGNAKFGNVFNHSIMLGVRYSFGSESSAPPPAPIATPTPAPAPARTYLVFFDWDRADLTDRARQIIAEAAQASVRVQTTRIEVQGNADRSGTPVYNQHLSLRRAQTVAAELVRLGVPQTAINILAFGDTRPLVPTAAGVREPQNRRVEIILR